MKKNKITAPQKSQAITELTQLRRKITRIDSQIAKQCSTRLELTRQVFALKSQNKLKMIDRQREQIVLTEYLRVLGAETSTTKIKTLVQAVIELSPSYTKSK